MPVEARVQWALGALLLFGVFFWVTLLVPATSSPRFREGWRWLQWRPFPHDLAVWMGAGALSGLVLQTVLQSAILASPAPWPPGLVILCSILVFQGLLAWVLYARLRRAGIDVSIALGLEAPFELRNPVAGLAAYCMSLPLVAIAGLLTQGLFVKFGWDMSNQPMLDELAEVSGWLNWATLFLLVGFIGPLLEEVVFRGFLFTWLRQKAGVGAGLVLQALVFAVIHQHAAGFLMLFALAVMLGLAYVYTRRLMVCVWMHVFFNSLTLINVLLSLDGGAG